MTSNRRHFIKGSFSGLIAYSMQAAITGLPLSFLTSGKVLANPNSSAKFMIIAASGAGEPINIHGPGTFPAQSGDLASRIVHADLNRIPASVNRTIDGISYNALDFATGVNINLGQQNVRAARAWQALRPDIRNHLVSFWHRTNVNAHTEFHHVVNCGGALKNENGGQVEQLPSALAQELAPALGTSSDTPLLFQNGFTARGAPLNSYTAGSIKSVFQDSVSSVKHSSFNALYTSTVNSAFKNIKANGTRTQMRFIDDHLLSRTEGFQMAESMGELLSQVDNSNSLLNQLRVALAMFKVKLTPVAIVSCQWGRDNHQAVNFHQEVEDSLMTLDSLNQFWQIAKEQGFEDKFGYAVLNSFGRTPHVSNNGGRDHAGWLTNGLIVSSNLKGGMVGGLADRRGNSLESSGFNSKTGGQANPDVPGGETLQAYFKTIMAAAGIAESRCDVRLPNGKIVRSVLA